MTTIKTSITVPQGLLNQAKSLAKRLDISQNQVFQMALEQFVEKVQDQLSIDEMNRLTQERLNLSEQSRASDQDTKTAPQSGEKPVIINQGGIYWLQGEESGEAQTEIHHPHVVIQENVLNHSRIHTVVVCALTSNLKRASFPGNVLLEVAEANLPKQSVVEISKVSTVNKAQLGEYVGSLSEQRISQILAGMRFLQTSFFSR